MWPMCQAMILCRNWYSEKYNTTFRWSSPARVAGFRDISRCMSINEIPSLFDALHINGRANCNDPEIPPIAIIKFPSPIDFPPKDSTRLRFEGQGV